VKSEEETSWSLETKDDVSDDLLKKIADLKAVLSTQESKSNLFDDLETESKSLFKHHKLQARENDIKTQQD